jgi:hypothetical protein
MAWRAAPWYTGVSVVAERGLVLSAVGPESRSSEMIFTLISFIEMKRSFDSIPISSDLVNTRPPAANSAVLSLPMLAAPSGILQRVPQITPHDVAEIDAEVRGVLSGEWLAIR